jgi:signal transduction histidine kinase
MTKQLNLFESDYFEDPEVDLQGLEDLKFKVHTSLIYKLGEELIKDEVTAITELVKNSYDADSPYVELSVDPNYMEDGAVGRIIIKDEGCGMDKKDIINGWLTISNSIKKKMKKEKRVTKKYERMPLGDKGLGRLAVQKLGRIMVMITKKENLDIEYTVTIPWGDFQKNTTLENVKVSCTERKVTGNLEQGYTTLIIKDLLNPNLWKKQENIDQLERELSQTISPFKKENTFYIYAKISERPLDFSNVSQEILDGSQLQFSFEVKNNSILLNGKMKLEYLNSRRSEIEVGADHVKEFLSLYNDKFKNIRLTDHPLYPIEVSEEIFLEDISGLRIYDNKGIVHPGDFSGYIYSYSLDNEFLKRQISNLNFRVIKNVPDFKNYIHQNYGVKIFRDDFAVLPYGYGEGGDWLALSKGQGTQGSFYHLKNETVIGYIQLFGKNSYNLREKTNREGFIQDDYYYNFFTINKQIIKRININIEKLKREFSSYLDKVATDTVHNDSFTNNFEVAVDSLNKLSTRSNYISKKIDDLNNKTQYSSQLLKQVDNTIKTVKFLKTNEKELLEKLINEVKENVDKTNIELNKAKSYIDEIHLIRNQLVVIEEEFNSIVGRMQELAELAGLGILAETLTHELNTLINNTKHNTQTISYYYKDNYQTDKKILQYFNYVRHSTDAMRKQLSHLSPNFKNVRTKKESINIYELLLRHSQYYMERAEKKGININILNEKNNYRVTVNIGMINQVLDNLYLNSEHWLLHSKTIKEISNLEYFIDIREGGKIHIWDNGIGIAENIAGEIFEPFVTNKDNGRGLGLYIVSQILDYHNCKIRLMRERNIYGKQYKFEIDLRHCLVFEGN